MSNTLESHKLFPYIAWTLVVGFAIFTYMLAMRLQEDMSSLGDRISTFEERVSSVEAR